jgi:hypothetical protein
MKIRQSFVLAALAASVWPAVARAKGERLVAGRLGIELERRAEERTGSLGCICRIVDLDEATELNDAAALPLFSITLRHVRTGKEVRVQADTGWGEVLCGAQAGGASWGKCQAEGLAQLTVRARCVARGERDAVGWSLRVDNPHEDWSVWRVKFPQIALRAFADDAHVLVPQAAGVVKRDAFRKPFHVRGTYPSGWTAMPFAAAYDAGGKTGLYVGAHDPNASTKDILVESNAERRQVIIAFDHPAPDMGKGRTGFALSGAAVWRLFRGDWFDACMIYRGWVRKEAKWWPKLSPDGRADTPAWMRELCVWGLLGGAPEGAVKNGRAFADAIGLPTGFHWYSWHQIPFDNDYPHYFPPKEGFRDAVAALQTKSRQPIYVMPYINGRLWDTRDKGAEDFEFTKLARAAATKDEKGEPRTETYGSKEADGTPVRLAAMCPATKLWQDRVSGIVLRLMKEYGCKAVYVDQIAAAQPRLCFDASHGHPLGGGGWWVEAYGRLLERLRRDMPAGCMLTTECNAEPYVKWFDGYLTWHWQYDGQVAAFPAVYGGAIQMFGRAYRGGPTKDLALRMKAGQQLCFGEQIGWIDAGIANQKASAAFLRQVAHLRYHLRRYFHAGQMARPPKLVGDVPTVTADWQWSGVWPVTTDAVMTGAWELPAARKLALIFVNVSDQPVTARVAFDAAAYGLGGAKLRLATLTEAGVSAAELTAPKFDRRMTFEPGKAWAWEIAPAETPATAPRAPQREKQP